MQTTRRQFLRSAAATVAAATIVPRHVLGGPGFVAPSDKVLVALVGAGGQGRTNVQALFREADAQVIAIADPMEQFSLDAFYYKGQGGRLPVQSQIEQHYSEQTANFRCAAYEDFREMLEREKEIDAVLCATPDHLHAYVSIRAMRAGKHVFCEKPLTHNVWEARQVAQIARDTGVATQMGNIGHSNVGIRQTCEWIWDGAIGSVREVHAWVGANRWNRELTGRPADLPDAKPGGNWDLWLGPRDPRPYHPAYHPVTWRDFWAFGGGAMGDFGCHDLDAACWALDLHEPLTVEARPAGNMNEEIAPHGEICYYEFGARGDRPPVKVTWYDGGLQPACPPELGRDDALPGAVCCLSETKDACCATGRAGHPACCRTRKPASTPNPQKHCRDRAATIATGWTPARAARPHRRISNTGRD